MNPHLLFPNRHFQYRHSAHNQLLVQDLQLQLIFKAMARSDDFLYQVARDVMLQSETDLETIKYRQDVLRDGLNQPKFMQSLYEIASGMGTDAGSLREQMKPRFGASLSVRSRLKTSLQLLELIMTRLSELRELGEHYRSQIQSPAMKSFYKRVEEHYSDLFFRQAAEHVNKLKRANMDNRLTIDMKIGDGLKSARAVLREVENTSLPSPSLLQRMLKTTTVSSTEFNFSEIQESALNQVVDILKRFIERTLQFFETLKLESAFYVGAVHLHEALKERGFETTFPEPLPMDERKLSFTGLIDVGLAVHTEQMLTANDLAADETRLVVITGANQGGKTTYLRSIGAAQLMMQSGMFVSATAFQANVCERIFTHFTQEEDAQLVSGRLDDELSRLDQIMGDISPHSLLLMNEPFLSTTEREGSAIAKDLLEVSYELRLKVFIVTHFYELASWCYDQGWQDALFLSPERDEQGRRTYRLKIAEPQPTSYGEELFQRVIGD